MARNTYSHGDWKAICWVCGREFKASQMRKHWEGYYVCQEDWEVRHPQDFVRGVADKVVPPWTQPEPNDSDSFILFCTPNGITAIAGTGVAGCAVAGYISPLFDPSIP